MANTLKFGNGQWATKYGSTLAYNDENGNFKPLPFTFERRGNATRVNKEGLIEIVGENIPRIDFSDNADGALLLEPSRTNLILNSEKIALSPTKNGTFVDNFAISPDGTQNATKITATNTDPFFYQNATFSAGDYTASIWVKGIGASIGQEFRFAISNVTHTANRYVIPAEWTRFEFTATIGAGTLSTGLELPDPAIVGHEVLVWGWQVEAGSFPTSYIKTTSAAVTRLADVCINGGNDQVINSTEGTIYAEQKSLETDFTYNYFVALSDGTNNNRLEIRQSGTALQFLWRVGGTYQGNILLSNAPFSSTIKYALRYSSTDIKFYVNGSLVGTINSPTLYPTETLDNVEFAEGSGGNNFRGIVKELKLYNIALTDEEAIELTQV